MNRHEKAPRDRRHRSGRRSCTGKARLTVSAAWEVARDRRAKGAPDWAARPYRCRRCGEDQEGEPVFHIGHLPGGSWSR